MIKTYYTQLSDIDQIKIINKCIENDIIKVGEDTKRTPIDKSYPIIGIEIEDNNEIKAELNLYKNLNGVSKEFILTPTKFKQFIKSYKPKTYPKIKLNDEYDALVLDDKVKVGCQYIPFNVIEELYKTIKSK
jgi:hypothetical protein